MCYTYHTAALFDLGDFFVYVVGNGVAPVHKFLAVGDKHMAEKGSPFYSLQNGNVFLFSFLGNFVPARNGVVVCKGYTREPVFLSCLHKRLHGEFAVAVQGVTVHFAREPFKHCFSPRRKLLY